MSKGVYVGVDSKARKVKKMYVGVDGVARKIKKAYVGVGGVARLFYATVDTVLANNTPEEIQAVAQSGQAANYWAVGDMVPITLNGTVGNLTFSNETYYAFIIGFDHNSSIEGSNTIHFQFGKTSAGVDIAFVDGYYGLSGGSGFGMNSSESNSGGWKSCRMRTTICPAFKSAMPSA